MTHKQQFDSCQMGNKWPKQWSLSVSERPMTLFSLKKKVMIIIIIFWPPPPSYDSNYHRWKWWRFWTAPYSNIYENCRFYVSGPGSCIVWWIYSNICSSVNILVLLVAAPYYPFGTLKENDGSWASSFIELETTCANCMMGSYISLSVCRKEWSYNSRIWISTYGIGSQWPELCRGLVCQVLIRNTKKMLVQKSNFPALWNLFVIRKLTINLNLSMKSILFIKDTW